MLGDVVFLTISIHAPREGCDSLLVCTRSACVPFQSTHPARGATRGWVWCSPRRRNFNPRTPRGVRRPEPQRLKPMSDFNPRTPRGVRRGAAVDVWTPGPISIHAPREGCDLCLCRRLTSTITISIHAPREGCDVITKFRRSLERDFNPRTPRGVRREVLDNGVVVHGNSNPRTPRGVRPRRKGLHWITDRFQSTHPARGATAGSWPTTSPNANFNPRTPRGVRRHRRPGRP